MQHEVIEVLGTIVKNKIVEECKKSGIFCVSMDGTEDNSATEMEVIVLRYWSEEINDMTEHALSMFPARDRTAKALTDNLLSELDSAGLSTDGLCSDCFDGASVMSGWKGGIQAFLTSKLKRFIIYVYCFNHRLYLVIKKVGIIYV